MKFTTLADFFSSTQSFVSLVREGKFSQGFVCWMGRLFCLASVFLKSFPLRELLVGEDSKLICCAEVLNSKSLVPEKLQIAWVVPLSSKSHHQD